MYLIQGFAIEVLLLVFQPANAAGEVGLAIAAFILASLGAVLLHRLVEEPARGFGKRIVTLRNERRLRQKRVEATMAVLETQPE
jgi:peptidoglycan/LPS O-acetylase OafA/YrhL